jgi:hypothetical protein
LITGEHDLVYLIRRCNSSETTVEFLNSNRNNLSDLDSQDFNAKVSWKEVKRLAKSLSCNICKNKIYSTDPESYNKLLIFSALREHSHNEKCFLLFEIVTHLNGYDLSYWTIYFKRAFWKGDIDGIDRLSNAFKLFFGLA